MHYYQFNIGDYAAHTRHLSLLEDLAYRRLLDLYYSSEKALTKDTKKLARLISMPENINEIEQVLEDFFDESEDGFTQRRVAEEIVKYHQKADAARANGKKGGRPRKANSNPAESESKAKETQSVILANPAESESKAKHKPRNINQETLTNNQDKKTTSRKTKAEKLVKRVRDNSEKWAALNCIDDGLLLEWAQLRYKKQTSDSDRAITTINNTLEDLRFNYGVSPDKAIGEQCDSGWKTVKVEYFNKGSQPRQQSPSEPKDLAPFRGNW